MYKSTKTTDEYKAVEFKRQFIENLNKPITKTRQVYLFDFIVLKFLEDKKRALRERTYNNYKLLLKNILPFFTEKIINDITKADIKNYENYRLINSCPESYLVYELKLLKNIFNYAIENEYIQINLFDHYNFHKIYKNYEPRERYLTPNECQRLINSCNPYLQRLVIFLLETGMRINETLNLLFTDLAHEQDTKIIFVRVRKEISKSKRERWIPLSTQAMEQVNKQKIDFPNSAFIFTDNKGNYYKTNPKKAFYNAVRKAELNPPFGFHILRHTFASLKLQGLDIQGNKIIPKTIELIAEILGHKDINLTKNTYAKRDKKALIEIL
ncbi:MAG: site-specific integrase [Rickettsiales bacterium]|nr:site-specific integrase [Rickettsiales bacterium]